MPSSRAIYRISDGLVVNVAKFAGHNGPPPGWEPGDPLDGLAVAPIAGGAIGDTWTGQEFVSPAEPEPPPPAPVYIPVATIRERLEAAGLWVALVAALPAADLAKLLTLREGVAPDDPRARWVLEAIGADPDAILARS